jgi:hypothetical protein
VLAHRAEFVGYFVLFQLGHCAEEAKFLQKLDKTMLQAWPAGRRSLLAPIIHTYIHFHAVQERPISFALSVWAALRTHNYAKVCMYACMYACIVRYGGRYAIHVRSE